MAKRKKGNGGKVAIIYDGRPSLCNNKPGSKQCFEQLYSTSHSLCINCRAEEVKMKRIEFLAGKRL